MDKIRIILGASLLFVSVQVNALIIDSADNTYFSDTESGLDWLDTSFSLGLSVANVLSLTGSGNSLEGWRYATLDDLILLISRFDGLDTAVEDILLRGRAYSDSPSWVSNGDYRWSELINLMGITYSEPSTITIYGWYDNLIGDGLSNMAYLDNKLDPAFSDFYQLQNYAIGVDHSNAISDWASWLVRDTISTAPEPTIIALMFTGLIGLGVARRKKLSR